LLQQRLKGTAPTGGQRRDAQRAFQLSAGMTGQVEQGIGLGDAHALRTIADFRDLIPGGDVAGLQHTEVEPGSVMLHQQGGHTRLFHSDSNSVARHSRLRHLEQCAANPITVAYANLIVRQSLHREVLAELSKYEVLSPQLPFPKALRIDLVDENGSVLATVTLQIPLAIAVDVQPSYLTATPDRVLPHGRAHGLTFPFDFARQTNVHREQLSHLDPSSWNIPYLDPHRRVFLTSGFSGGWHVSGEGLLLRGRRASSGGTSRPGAMWSGWHRRATRCGPPASYRQHRTVFHRYQRMLDDTH